MKKEETKEKTTKKGTTTKGKETTKNTTTTKKQTNKTTQKKNNNSQKNTSKKSNNDKKENTKTKKEVVEEIIVEEDLVEELDEEVEEKTTKVKKVEEEKKSKSKGDLFLILGLIIVVVLGCFLMKGEKEVPDYELPLTLSGEVGLQQLTYAEYQEKIDNDESFVVIIERATCSHCVTYMPIAEEFASTNSLPMYYVDTDTFTEEDWSSFEKSNTYFKEKGQNWGTPTTLVLAGKDAVDNIEGTTDAESLLDLYNKYFEMEEE